MSDMQKTESVLEQSFRLQQNGDYSRSEDLINSLLLSENIEKHEIAKAHCILGGGYLRTGRYPLAESSLTEALLISRDLNNASLISRAQCGLGWVAFHRGKFDDALTMGRTALEYAENGKDNYYIADSMRLLGQTHTNFSKHSQAKEYLLMALNYAEEANSESLTSQILGDIGNLYLMQVDYQHALEFTLRSYRLAEEIGNKNLILSGLQNLANIQTYLFNNANALEYLFQALQISIELNSQRVQAKVLGNIGSVYNHIHDYQKGLEYHLQSAAIAEKIGAFESLAIALGNAGGDYNHLGDNEQALIFLHRALELSQKIGAQRPAGYWMFEITKVERKRGNDDAAHTGLVEVLQHMRALNTNELVASILNELGSFLIDQDRIEESLAYLQEAIALAEELGEKRNIRDSHKILSSLYDKKRDFTKAFVHVKKYLAIEEEINGEESRKQIEGFNIRIAIAEKENERKIAEMRTQQLEKELALQAAHLVTQTEFLVKFREELLHIVRKYPATELGMRELRDKLREMPCKQIDWDKFEAQFAEVVPDFKMKLREKYSELTDMEVKICSMLRLKLKSHEIARLFCINERSVETHRFNIRKKLHLGRDENLNEFLGKV